MKSVKKITGDWQKELKDFLLWKKSQGASERTLYDYNKHVNIFFRRHPDALQNIETACMEYMSENIKPCTYNLRRAYLKCFCDYLMEDKLIKVNPFAKLPKRKVNDKIIDIPIDTLQKLLSIPDKNTFAGLRDYSFMLTMLDCGVRPNEILQLVISDFDFKHYCVTIPEQVAKTRHSRNLPLSIETVRAITKLINYRPGDWKDDIPVFCSCEGETLGSDVMSRRFAYYSKKLDVYITPYALRHCFALYYLRNGGGSLHLQTIMGHETLDMTRKYVALSDTDIKSSHNSYTPIKNVLPPKKTGVRKVKK